LDGSELENMLEKVLGKAFYTWMDDDNVAMEERVEMEKYSCENAETLKGFAANFKDFNQIFVAEEDLFC
jgi:hypothetical protein